MIAIGLSIRKCKAFSLLDIVVIWFNIVIWIIIENSVQLLQPRRAYFEFDFYVVLMYYL